MLTSNQKSGSHAIAKGIPIIEMRRPTNPRSQTGISNKVPAIPTSADRPGDRRAVSAIVSTWPPPSFTRTPPMRPSTAINSNFPIKLKSPENTFPPTPRESPPLLAIRLISSCTSARISSRNSTRIRFRISASCSGVRSKRPTTSPSVSIETETSTCSVRACVSTDSSAP